MKKACPKVAATLQHQPWPAAASRWRPLRKRKIENSNPIEIETTALKCKTKLRTSFITNTCLRGLDCTSIIFTKFGFTLCLEPERAGKAHRFQTTNQKRLCHGWE
jgi:hypothetical protein